MKRQTTQRHRDAKLNVLQVRVMSPRIAWFGFLKFTGKLAKFVCVVGVLAGLGWGAWRGIHHVFYRNPDFRLQVIELNANPVIDEFGVAALAEIDLRARPSLFEVDVTEVANKLRGLPGVTDAQVERHLPGKLVVRVTPRSPVAWVVNTGTDLSETRHAGALLVDRGGVPYSCPEMQTGTAATLPVIELPTTDEHPIIPGEKIHLGELENCLSLLDSARAADPNAPQWIMSLRQTNEWSLELVTREGTVATFGLREHARQIERLRAALDHAGEKGYLIDTINLIPKYNVPITVRNSQPPPKAIPVSTADAAAPRRGRDLSHPLNNRN